MLKLRKGSTECEPHVKHFLDTTQIELYEIFINDHTQLNLGQRSFEKCKPWYVHICIDRNTCYCRYHVEYEYFYDTYKHTFFYLHINIEQDYNESVIPLNALTVLSLESCVQGMKDKNTMENHFYMGIVPGAMGFLF